MSTGMDLGPILQPAGIAGADVRVSRSGLRRTRLSASVRGAREFCGLEADRTGAEQCPNRKFQSDSHSEGLETMRSAAAIICAILAVMTSGREGVASARAEEQGSIPDPVRFTPRARSAVAQTPGQAIAPAATENLSLPAVEPLREGRIASPPSHLIGSAAAMRATAALAPEEPQSSKRAPRRTEVDDERPSSRTRVRVSCAVFGDTNCADGD